VPPRTGATLIDRRESKERPTGQENRCNANRPKAKQGKAKNRGQNRPHREAEQKNQKPKNPII
jgi:hypothetical protein